MKEPRRKNEAIFLLKGNTQTLYRVSRVDYTSETIWGHVMFEGFSSQICEEFPLKDVDIHSLSI